MTIAVTGATGQLGRLIVEDLIEAGVAPDQIVAVGRSAERLAGLPVRTAVASYEDVAALTAAFEGVDTLVLVSGSEVGQRVPQHTNAIEAAKAAGVTRVVYTSAPHADTSDLLLVPEHRATEELLRASGLAWTIVRNNWYTENYAQTVAQARETGVILTSTGTGRVASASRADYAAGAAAVAAGEGHEGRVYELTGDVAWTFDEFAAAVAEVLGTPVVHQAVSADEHAEILGGAGLDEGTVGFVVGLDQGIARGDLADATADLRTLIGRPTTPLAETLRTL
ncbi:SDR family oxidoreductase [Cellulomonas sp. PhB150]|uniref:SDR family oxidoreductase n=1 Tax=Cellulomonas sp. PhB150 TaxID=2485188 RepID=UPI000F4A1C2E|nr:SDR family oxidoreductase [Cellulomonas sp. PhB150]ROS26043.1 NAD(P)H dehydrogenase (quinone) [Cellulomonas sp. PhB150]